MNELLEILQQMSKDMVWLAEVIEKLIARTQLLEERINLLENNQRHNGDKSTKDEGLEWVRA